MKRNLFRFSSVVVAALAVAACTDDPTEAFRQGATQVATSLSYVEITIGDSVVVTAQTRDAQGNALSALPAATAANPAVASVNTDTIISGKPAPETQFSILANGFGTTTVTATTDALTSDITVQTWPASVGITGTTAGTPLVSGAALALTATSLSTGNAAFGAGNADLYYVWATDNASVVNVDATGNITASDVGLAVISIESFRLSDSLSTGAVGSVSLQVIAQTFAGTASATAATGGQLVTITQAAGGDPFDANTAVTIIPNDVTIDPLAATVTGFTATTLTFANPLNATATTPVMVQVSGVGAADVSQAFAMDVVGPFAFDGTVSTTTASVGDVITVTAGATYPWDGDETFAIGGNAVDPLFIISQNTTSATFALPNPNGGATGGASLLTISNQTAAQVQSGVDITLSPYPVPGDPTAAPDITAGPFPLVFYASMDDFNFDGFWSLAPATPTAYTVSVEWANGSDYDILWYDANGACCYLNFDGAGSSNPEVSSTPAFSGSDLPGGALVLNVDLYDSHGEGATLVKITVTSP